MVEDEWSKKLDIQLEILKKCQVENKLSSCISCLKLLDCEIRKEYIDAVYISMNKNKSGGFEF